MSTSAGHAERWTVGRLLAWTQEYFRQRGLESPRLCAEILLAHVLKTERLRLYTTFDQEPPAAAREAFRELVRRAAGGAPIAYLVGIKEFFSLPFEVGPDVLIPRPETEILVERTITLFKGAADAAPLILDLCTGSGCIAIALARHLPAARILASDISEGAIVIARRNAERHGVAGRIEFRVGDLLDPWRPDAAARGPFDVIVCNPPYVAAGDPAVEPSVRNYEPHVALFAGADGLEVIRRVLGEAPAWLRSGGHLLMEVGYNQAAAVRRLVSDPLWTSATSYRDGGGHERVVHVRAAPVASQVNVA